MSAARAAFSSSRRSTRSMKDFRCSFAKPLFAMVRSVVKGAEASPRRRTNATISASLAVGLLRGGEGGFLLGARLFLVALLPFRRSHAVDDLPRLVLFERDALLRRRLAVPVAQAVAAEAGQVHQID